MTVPDAIFSAETDDWLTPPWVFDPLHREFGFQLDLAASTGHERVPYHLPPEVDSLTVGWAATGWTTGWCNPPYSNDKAFIRKAAEEARLGFTTVMLVYAKTDVAWWHDVVMREASEVRLVRGRISFLRPGGGAAVGAPKGSAVVVFRPKACPSAPHFSSISFPKP